MRTAPSHDNDHHAARQGAFLVTGKDIEARTFGSRREAKDWCAGHYPGSPIMEIGRGAAKPPTRKTEQAVTRIEQRGAVAFTGAGIAAVVILLITLWGYLF